MKGFRNWVVIPCVGVGLLLTIANPHLRHVDDETRFGSLIFGAIGGLMLGLALQLPFAGKAAIMSKLKEMVSAPRRAPVAWLLDAISLGLVMGFFAFEFISVIGMGPKRATCRCSF